MEAGYNNMISALEVYYYPERFDNNPLESLVPELFGRHRRQYSHASPAVVESTQTSPPTGRSEFAATDYYGQKAKGKIFVIANCTLTRIMNNGH